MEEPAAQFPPNHLLAGGAQFPPNHLLAGGAVSSKPPPCHERLTEAELFPVKPGAWRFFEKWLKSGGRIDV
ncbi:MAG: hypothetical protein HYW48_06760 [Deltaproteobacteria bacterium]|nr:hypothetical protein [Deltaproteobacteria bacterium]